MFERLHKAWLVAEAFTSLIGPIEGNSPWLGESSPPNFGDLRREKQEHQGVFL